MIVSYWTDLPHVIPLSGVVEVGLPNNGDRPIEASLCENILHCPYNYNLLHQGEGNAVLFRYQIGIFRTKQKIWPLEHVT